MSQAQFGTWAAIAIHDTSSVVGAGETYGPDALKLATLIKLTRALWIIPLAFVTMLMFRDKTAKVSIPWFIFLFILAMVVNTYCGLPAAVSEWCVWLAKRGLVLTLLPYRLASLAALHYKICGCASASACYNIVDSHRRKQLLCSARHHSINRFF